MDRFGWGRVPHPAYEGAVGHFRAWQCQFWYRGKRQFHFDRMSEPVLPLVTPMPPENLFGPVHSHIPKTLLLIIVKKRGEGCFF